MYLHDLPRYGSAPAYVASAPGYVLFAPAYVAPAPAYVAPAPAYVAPAPAPAPAYVAPARVRGGSASSYVAPAPASPEYVPPPQSAYSPEGVTNYTSDYVDTTDAENARQQAILDALAKLNAGEQQTIVPHTTQSADAARLLPVPVTASDAPVSSQSNVLSLLIAGIVGFGILYASDSRKRK